jgi:hypothetical protein
MAQQIKKKFLDPEVISYFDNQIVAVDQKVDQEVLARQAAVTDLQNQINSLGGDYATDAELAAAVSSLEQSIAAESSARQLADQGLDTRVSELESDVSSLESQLSVEKGRIDAILAASSSDADSFKEIVDLINSVDTENDNAFAGYVLSNNAALAQEVSDRQAGDAQTLLDAKAYTDSKVADYYTKSEIDAKDSAVQASVTDLEVYAQDIRNDVDALDVYAQDIRTDHDALDLRVQSLEANGFAKGSVTIGANLEYIDLNRLYKTVLSVSVGRLAVHEGEDYVLSVVGGVTRLTWIGSLAHPDGVEKIEMGDKVFYSGAY